MTRLPPVSAMMACAGRSDQRDQSRAVSSVDTEVKGRHLQVALEWGDGEGRLSVDETGHAISRRTVPVPQPDEIEVVSRELARLGRDIIFEDALASAARIQAALTS